MADFKLILIENQLREHGTKQCFKCTKKNFEFQRV